MEANGIFQGYPVKKILERVTKGVKGYGNQKR